MGKSNEMYSDEYDDRADSLKDQVERVHSEKKLAYATKRAVTMSSADVLAIGHLVSIYQKFDDSFKKQPNPFPNIEIFYEGLLKMNQELLKKVVNEYNLTRGDYDTKKRKF